MKNKSDYRKERLDRGIKARSDSIFLLSSYRDLLYMIFPRLILIGGLILTPFVLNLLGQVYWHKVFILMCIMTVLALSWELLALSGMFSLGQTLFFGVGGYISGAFNHYLGWPLFLSIPIATLGGGVICTCLLIPVLRLRGVYFAMITLALPVMLARVIEATRIFGGTEGLSSLSSFPSLWAETYLIVVMLLIFFFGFRRLMNSDYGLVLRSINDNDQAIMASGGNIYWYKIQVLFLASATGAFAGAFMSHHIRFVGIPVFALDIAILPIAAGALGGMGAFAGSTIGTFILVFLSENLRVLGSLRIAIYCLVMVACVVGLPEGIFHYIQRKYNQFERWVPVGLKEK